jgi:hypothetical protein
MGSGSVLWAETPDEEGADNGAECEAHGDVDETFAARRLRRWIKGMFGGATSAAEPDEPGREEDS